MEYSQELKGNSLIFRIEEQKLNTSVSVDVKDILLNLLENADIINLFFNLSSVQSIDSSGLSSLLFGRRQVTERGGKCSLINPQPKVVSLLKIARLDKVFESFDDEGDALKSVS
ncbi:MAG: STAS domain-containing protein [Candidatus Marinimicrobia bacterium]|nr:STAS domain-containing protein [Candidatus Neomarinimicrobiota bacterium]